MLQSLVHTALEMSVLSTKIPNFMRKEIGISTRVWDRRFWDSSETQGVRIMSVHTTGNAYEAE
jgi:hypothetical protein